MEPLPPLNQHPTLKLRATPHLTACKHTHKRTRRQEERHFEESLEAPAAGPPHGLWEVERGPGPAAGKGVVALVDEMPRGHAVGYPMGRDEELAHAQSDEEIVLGVSEKCDHGEAEKFDCTVTQISSTTKCVA